MLTFCDGCSECGFAMIHMSNGTYVTVRLVPRVHLLLGIASSGIYEWNKYIEFVNLKEKIKTQVSDVLRVPMLKKKLTTCVLFVCFCLFVVLFVGI